MLGLIAGEREEELYDRVPAHHRMASDQSKKSQQRTPSFLEKLRVRYIKEGEMKNEYLQKIFCSLY